MKLSMPEQTMLRQEASADEIPRTSNEEDENNDEDAPKEPRMYFIAKGKYSVFIKKSHVVSSSAISLNGDKTRDRADRTLQEGDHFGEIGLIYGCKRTATVESNNYGTLAMLTKSNYLDL